MPGNNSHTSSWETWQYFTSNLENTLLAPAVMVEQIRPTKLGRVGGWSQAFHVLEAQQQGVTDDWRGQTYVLRTANINSPILFWHYFPQPHCPSVSYLKHLSLWAVSMNKGKALEWDSHRTHTISHTTESLKGPTESLSLLNFTRLKVELLPSPFPASSEVMPVGNAPWNPNQNNLYFPVTLTLWKSTFCTALLSGAHGTNHCPRETLLYLLYWMRISRHSLLQTSALYSFCNTAATLNIRLTVKPSDSVLNSWVPFWTKSSSFFKD